MNLFTLFDKYLLITNGFIAQGSGNGDRFTVTLDDGTEDHVYFDTNATIVIDPHDNGDRSCIMVEDIAGDSWEFEVFESVQLA